MQKKTFLFMLISGIVLAFGGLFMFLFSFFTWISNFQKSATVNLVLIICGIVIFFVGCGILLWVKRISKKFCKKCHNPLFGCEYSWVLTALDLRRARDESFTYQVACYDITAICPHCEKEKKFHQEFLATDFTNGTQINTQKLIEDWCREMFGH